MDSIKDKIKKGFHKEYFEPMNKDHLKKTGMVAYTKVMTNLNSRVFVNTTRVVFNVRIHIKLEFDE